LRVTELQFQVDARDELVNEPGHACDYSSHDRRLTCKTYDRAPLLAAACNPDPLLPPSALRAATGDIVHAAPGPTYWEGDDPDAGYDEPNREYHGRDDGSWDDDTSGDDTDDDATLPDDEEDWDEDDLAWQGQADDPPNPADRAARARRAAPGSGASGRDRGRRHDPAGTRGGRR